MVVLILERVTPSLRGELTRWLIEPHPGVFIGHISAMVRDRLWEKCCQAAGEGAVLQAWSKNNEQHFSLRTWGHTRREVVDFVGLYLVRIRPTERPPKDEN